MASLLPHKPTGTKHEPARELLGQCGRGVLLRQPQERTNQEADLQDLALATEDISDYIVCLYNRARRHSYLNGVSPEKYDEAVKRK